jgi:hypothetical protein
MPRAPHRFVRFVVILLCAISLSANGEPATREGLITNQYVRVSRVELAAHDSFSLPKNGHFHILISGSTPSVSVARSDNREPVAASQNLWTLDEAHSYQISNCGEVQLSVTLLDVLTSPGRIICSNGNACPWSIRSLDPVPVFLSDHLTIFRIPLPWRPEAHSVIVPSVSMLGFMYFAVPWRELLPFLMLTCVPLLSALAFASYLSQVRQAAAREFF